MIDIDWLDLKINIEYISILYYICMHITYLIRFIDITVYVTSMTVSMYGDDFI